MFISLATTTKSHDLFTFMLCGFIFFLFMMDLLVNYDAGTRVRVSGVGVNLGVGQPKLKNTKYGDMDPDLDMGAGIRYTIICRICFS